MLTPPEAADRNARVNTRGSTRANGIAPRRTLRAATSPRKIRGALSMLALVLGLVVAGEGSATAAAFPVIVANTTNASAAGPLVVSIGDSILKGHGLDADQAWLAILAKQDGFRLTNLASDGSGFVTAGDNNDTFADQVKAAVGLKPSVVVISGSSNDLGQSDSAIATATALTVAKLRARLPGATIIAVSAVWGDTAVPAQLASITADVAGAVSAAGGLYLNIGQPLAAQPELLQADDVHPTAAGQIVLANAVATALTAANIVL